MKDGPISNAWYTPVGAIVALGVVGVAGGAYFVYKLYTPAFPAVEQPARALSEVEYHQALIQYLAAQSTTSAAVSDQERDAMIRAAAPPQGSEQQARQEALDNYLKNQN